VSSESQTPDTRRGGRRGRKERNGGRGEREGVERGREGEGERKEREREKRERKGGEKERKRNGLPKCGPGGSGTRSTFTAPEMTSTGFTP